MKKIFLTSLIVFASLVGAQTASAAVQDVFGYACSQNIGCFSLNSVSSAGQPGYAAQPSSFKVQYDTTTTLFSGTAWSPAVGTINFGVGCAPITPAISGNECAKVVLAGTSTADIAAAGGWMGVINLQNVQASAPGSSTFSGKGWEGWNSDNYGGNPADVGVGWVDFTNASLVNQQPVTCGTANGTIVSSAPTANLCSDGSTPVTGPTLNNTLYNWTCGPQNTACSATYKGPGGAATCDPIAISIPTNTLPSNLCESPSTLSGTVSGSNPWSWTCKNGTNTTTCQSIPLGSSTTGVSCGNTFGTCNPGTIDPALVQATPDVPVPGQWTCTDSSQNTPITITCGGTLPNTGPLKPIFKEN